MSVHRTKTYSAESGYVYQYAFRNSRRTRRGLFAAGTEYIFEISGDRKSTYRLPVFVADGALKSWERKKGRELSSAEQYAAAKLGLLRAFDRAERPAVVPSDVVVDAASIHDLLAPLDL